MSGASRRAAEGRTFVSITAAESLVMRAVWAAVDAGAEGGMIEGLRAELGPGQGWGEATLRTLIHRLVKKGALTSARRGANVVYRPRLRREDWVTAESQGLLDRLFGGQLAPLVAHFAKERVLDDADLDRLRRLVAELDRDAADEEG